MRLGEKLVHLRQVEGQMRGLTGALSKAELVRAMSAELGQSLSQAYLSQIESGARVHLSARTRDLLARFFKVHPGYLVDDPPGYQTEILSAPLPEQDRLRSWLATRAEEQRSDPLVYRLFARLSEADDPREYISLFDELLDLDPKPIQRLAEQAAARTAGAQLAAEAFSIDGGEGTTGQKAVPAQDDEIASPVLDWRRT